MIQQKLREVPRDEDVLQSFVDGQPKRGRGLREVGADNAQIVFARTKPTISFFSVSMFFKECFQADLSR